MQQDGQEESTTERSFRFAADYAKRESKCQVCRVTIPVGTFRLKYYKLGLCGFDWHMYCPGWWCEKQTVGVFQQVFSKCEIVS